MTRFTRLIKQKIQESGDTKESLAKALKITPGFVNHLQYSDQVPVSPRLIAGLAKRYKIPVKKLAELAIKRNAIGRAYYRQYRAKSA